MSISDRETKVGGSTSANATAAVPNFAVVPPMRDPSTVTRRREISDRESVFIKLTGDFVSTCIALPLSLLIFSVFSAVRVNSLALFGQNLIRDCIFPVAVVIALACGGMYRVAHQRLQPSAFLEARDLAFGVGLGCVIALGVGAFLHSTAGIMEANSTQLVFAVIVTVVVITFGRILLRFFLRALTTTRVLVVGSGTMANRITLSVRQDPGMTLVGRVVAGDEVESGALGRVRDLPALCQALAVHRILVAFPDEITGESLDTYRQLQDSVHIAMVPRFYELVSWRSRLTDMSGMPFLEIARPHLSIWDQFIKRAFDVAVSSLVLFLTSPILLVVAIGVKLSSPGPVFFRQVRLGRKQQPFTVTKFRSMTVGTEVLERTGVPVDEDEDLPLHEIRKKKDESARITKFGALLRRSGLDEIPQFINVFKGEMSVVGPRPFIPEESKVEGWGARRFDVRPGITGLWQVSGRNDLSRADLVQLDYLYVASWSLWWDLKIMWETPRTMARGTGAY
ncbi:MAG TPA: sugar transferase [Acidimicrobiales bacterium]|jgi:exopolysaccharide biosynthesis polyprenyl glycosylphosphotransferase